eukprot:TRINITY_DN3903_c0_g1_i1.p1 TRINITY_DN3903_c0_g1~~TRINITY_DN3903_c0_g1_i1.p1  ORF type:complete len:138 (-),score=30.07 TRINITY_DN3903_c0_g1_i1:199-552(-)
MSSYNFRTEDAEREQYSRLLDADEKLYSTSDRLQRTRQIAAETEEIGQQVITDLENQNQKLGGFRGTLYSIGDHMSVSRVILFDMTRKMCYRKGLLIVIILILIATIILIIWLKWIK